VSAHGLYQRLSQLLAIASAKTIRLEDTPVALQRLLVRAGEAPDLDFLLADLADRQRAVRALFEQIVGPVDP
jgi:glutamate-ammonia-ligase adenylyltransferase